MFSGLIDNYTPSVLIFAAIHMIAAYSFFAPFKTGQVSLGPVGLHGDRSLRLRDRGHPEVGPAFRGRAARWRRWSPASSGLWSDFPALRIKGRLHLLLTLGSSGEIVSGDHR